MAKGIKRKLDRVREKVSREIEGFAKRGGLYAGAMAAEGYNGGYRDALDDVVLALNGITPQRHNWWREEIINDTD